MKIQVLTAVFVLGLLAVLFTGCGGMDKTASVQEETVSTVPFSDLMPELDLTNVRDILEVTTTEPETTTPPETTTEEETTTEPETEAETTTSPEVELGFLLPVIYGDRSQDVAKLQERLIELGYLPEGSADGSFGPMTRDAVMNFQKANGLEATGELDGETYRKLKSVHAVTAWGYTQAEVTSLTAFVEAPAEPGHVHSFVPRVVEPTCYKGGYTVYSCACGSYYGGDFVVSPGHEYAATVLRQGSCTRSGEMNYTCIRCGDSYNEVTPASGHNYVSYTVSPTCTEYGYTSYSCTWCGDSFTSGFTPPYGHSYDPLTGRCVICGAYR